MDDPHAEEMGVLVRTRRTKRGWTNEELARRAGVAQGTITRIERGQPVRVSNLRSVLDALDLKESVPQVPSPDVRAVVGLVANWLEGLPLAQRGPALLRLGRLMAEFDPKDAVLKEREDLHLPNGTVITVKAALPDSATLDALSQAVAGEGSCIPNDEATSDELPPNPAPTRR